MKALAKSVFLKDVARMEKEKWDRIQSSLQHSVSKLSELTNTTFGTVEDLEAISLDWLNGQIERSRQNLRQVLGAGSFIPAGISKQFDDNYNAIMAQAEQPVEDIVSVLASVREKGVGIKIDSKGRPWLNEKDVREKVEASATYTFPDGQMEAFAYFQAVSEALNALRKYEKDHGLTPCDIPEVFEKINRDNIARKGKNSFDIEAEMYFSLIAYGKILLPLGFNANDINDSDDEEGNDQ